MDAKEAYNREFVEATTKVYDRMRKEAMNRVLASLLPADLKRYGYIDVQAYEIAEIYMDADQR